MTTLKDKAILITGSARRIGRIISLGLFEANLILHYHKSEKDVLNLKMDLEKRGCRPLIFQADLTNPDEIKKLFDFILEKHGHLDVLINNAASYKKTDFSNLKDFDSSILLNLKAPLMCSQHAAQVMNKGASIINIGDKSAKKPFNGYLMHSISKAALEHATKALALELAPKIRVNNLLLGAMLASDGDQKELFEKLIDKHVLVKRAPEEKDIVKAIHFLILNSYVNSTTLELDGGWI